MLLKPELERGGATVVWPAGVPVAPQPASLGNESWTRLYRFEVVVSDASVARDMVVTAAGTMTAIANWGIVTQTPPMGGQNGVTLWEPVLAGEGVEVAAATLVVHIVPGAGTGMTVVGGWLVLAARRRMGGVRGET